MPDKGRVEVTGGAVFVYPSGQGAPAVVGMEYAVRALLAHGALVEALREILPLYRERCPSWPPFPGPEVQRAEAALALAEKGGA